MTRHSALLTPLSHEGESHDESVIEDVLTTEYLWTRPQIAELLRMLRLRSA